MFRVGIYTGNLYPDETNPNDIRECCLTFVDGKMPTDESLKERINHHHKKCIGCYGCEEAKKARCLS